MASQPGYVFARDLQDNNRINLQHHQWVQLFGYHLHPQIPTTDPKLRIADIGTGTGAWVADLSAILPETVKLDGLDLSLNATPPLELLPPNVSFRQLNIKDDIPEDLIEQYDVVHIRLFIFVLLDEEIPKIIQQLARLIKPGGYLQWGEIDMTSFRVEKTRPTNKVEALSRLYKLSQGLDSRLAPTWVPRLDASLRSGGFCDIQVDKRDTKDCLAFSMHECNMMVPEGLARTTRNETFAKELQCLMPEVADETRKGAYWAFTRWTVVAKKAVSPTGGVLVL